MAINAKKRLFAQAILDGMSNRDACIHAGYSEKSASTKGAMLAKDPEIIAYIEKCKSDKKSAKDALSESKKVQVVQVSRIEQKQEEAQGEFVGRGEIPIGAQDDPLEYLRRVWTDETEELENRMKAAIAGLPYVHGKVAAKGKKETRAEEAKNKTGAGGGKFSTLNSQLPS
ncbi:terminase small subunit [Acinetobacter pollinis]|uniref:terminase small subunit n=1 Tax=Acinetobacter pollinis TaxID=2605270 RepID=UPI0018C1EA5A|nr:terminase small subunit [Acinetobacter pollinis]MBF7693459.1 terminase small subunit [Acinetobacter pollinis]MBF7700971.1 terminase small subunit [Acinetobacter pollinis]